VTNVASRDTKKDPSKTGKSEKPSARGTQDAHDARNIAKRATALSDQGWQCRKSGKDAKARQKAMEALDAYPAHVDAKNLLGLLCVDRFEFQEAGKFYKKAILDAKKEHGRKTRTKVPVVYWDDPETRPYVRALHGYGFCLAYQGRHQEALSQFTALLRLDPEDHSGVQFLLADLYHFLDDAVRAEKYYKKHASWQSFFTYPLLLLHAGRDAEARLLLKRAFNAAPIAKGIMEDYLHCFVLWEMLGAYRWGEFPAPSLQANAVATAQNKAMAGVDDEKSYDEAEAAVSFCKFSGPLWLKYENSYDFLKQGRPA
jgi:tetratricopeptide (TPR) repeat protein